MIPQRYLFVLATFLLTVLLYIDRVCVSIAKKPIAGDLGLSNEQMGWIFSAFSLGYALCQTPSGLLADRFGPRRILSAIVAFWSLFTGLTGAAWNFASLLIVRFTFGAGEAGAMPSVARAVYAWIPLRERGLMQGINFSGMRLGGAFAMPAVAWLIQQWGWRLAFVILMIVGLGWSVFWWLWFRDDPTQHPRITPQEREFILSHRQAPEAAGEAPALSTAILFRSRNLWLAMLQYFASNFTFFFCLTWLPPYLQDKYSLDPVQAGLYSMWPLIGGAIGNLFSGWLVDRIYRAGRWTLSRRAPAMIGFALAAAGLLASRQMASAGAEVFWLALAIFGADMTLPPSWSLCVDIGRRHSGAVSGTMNMAGNIGSFVTALAFPYLIKWTGGPATFFYAGAVLNLLAVGTWALLQPERKIEDY